MTTQQIPRGWRFYTADFSIENRDGQVTLVRDTSQTQVWHQLNEVEQELTELYIVGRGATFELALARAVERATDVGVLAPKV